MSTLRRLWNRYQSWRATPGNRRPEPKKPVPKIDASDGDIASHVTSNPGGGWGGTG